ncbi:MAG: cysteine synthase CysM [Proteobacteria bacterium]|nr:cysteine synthase CysM [Pseudomonadota bacterium]MDP4618708.1 cysteine synthase CysM [Burkholderiaceae bacterium]HCO57577.1 cysteine synthase B [Burkholderiales bacterium]MDA0876329.1 cysteine synthase CysM [Pseudomonadota bacterium]MDP4677644.1 cysteine synthase CysM [Burkholderiaceae bacterium]
MESVVGQTPLVRLRRLGEPLLSSRGNLVLGKLEGNNPAGSVKDRPALSMISRAEQRGEIKPGDMLIEATSGNTGIALAMAAAIRGFRMRLIMPDNLSVERRQTMRAFGAELVLVTQTQGMEGARDLAMAMQARGEGKVLDQFANDDNWMAHYEGTGPEIWAQTQGAVTHFVSAMGTTGTITGVSRFLKEKNPEVQIIGVQPTDGSSIPGIRKWSEDYIPPIRSKARIDQIEEVTQADAEAMARELALTEGLFCGPSAAGACSVALRLAESSQDAVIVFIVCDRGDRYLSTNLFPS